MTGSHPRIKAFLMVAVLVPGLLTSSVAVARRLPADQLTAHLLAVADREWRSWGRTEIDATDGDSRIVRHGATETDEAWMPDDDVADAEGARKRGQAGCPPLPAARAQSADSHCTSAQAFDAVTRLRRYWVEGLGPDSKPAGSRAALERVVRAEPWSAVFISFVMREVGLSARAFPFDDTHSNYLRGLAKRAAQPPDDGAQFVLLLIHDTPLARGDLVCGPRNISHDPGLLTLQAMRRLSDLHGLTASHCDIVVAIDRQGREARLIGGNVADSVAMTRIALTSDGRAIRTLSRPLFILARPR
jgi:hypothetical protein